MTKPNETTLALRAAHAADADLDAARAAADLAFNVYVAARYADPADSDALKAATIARHDAFAALRDAETTFDAARATAVTTILAKD